MSREEARKLPLSGPVTSVEETKYLDDTEFEIPTSFLKSTGAVVELSAKDTPTASLARWLEMRKLEDSGPMVQPEDLNAKNPDLGGIYKEPMSQKSADYIANEHRERRRLQDIIDRGPDGFIPGATNFIAGMVPHALDPIGLGASLVTSGLATAALTGTRFGRALGYASKLGSLDDFLVQPRNILAKDVLEGFVGNVAVDAPITMQQADRELRDYGTKDMLMNSMVGAVGFAGVKYLGLKALDKFTGKSKWQVDTEAKTATGQMLNDKRVDVELLNPNKIDENGNTVPKTEEEIRVDTEKAKEYTLSRESDVDYDPEFKVDEEPLLSDEQEFSEMEAATLELQETVRELEAEGGLDSEALKAVKELEVNAKRNDGIQKGFKAFMNCMLGE